MRYNEYRLSAIGHIGRGRPCGATPRVEARDVVHFKRPNGLSKNNPVKGDTEDALEQDQAPER
jgi:hypothetical protein